MSFSTTRKAGWRWGIATAWVSIGLLALPLALTVNERLDTSTKVEGSESALVQAALRQRFKSPYTEIALLRVASGPAAQSNDGRALLTQVDQALRTTPGVEGVTSYQNREDRLFVGQDGSALLLVGLDTAKASGDVLTARLRQTTETLRRKLADQYPQLAFHWTGEAAINADMRRLSAEEMRAAELRVLPMTLILLLVAFRSLISAVLPIICGALTICISLGTVAALSRVWPMSIVVGSVISMVGLGLSIDYALLIVSRYRDGLEEGLSRQDAVAQAARYGGRTVLVSGSAVAIGFAALLWVNIGEVRSIGMGGLVVTTVSVLIAATFLPLLLGWLSPWISARPAGSRGVSQERHWRRWASWVTRHPLAVLLVAGAPMLLLASQAAHLRTDLPRGRWLPESAESVRVLHEVDAVGRGNFGQIVHVILNLPAGTVVSDEDGWRAEARLARFFARDPRIQHVWAVTTLSTVPLAGPETLRKVPESVRRGFVSEDGRSALLELLPRPGLPASEVSALVRDIRASNLDSLTGLAGASLQVGGVAAFNADYESATRNAIGPVVVGVIGATLLVLSLAFRSVLIPIKAVALNLLSVAAAFGAVALVFQEGHGSRLMGLLRPLDGGFPIVPLLVFCIVFGLSMDYEVFIVSRVAHGRRMGLSDEDALIAGLASTGRVVTFAAAIMVMIFGAFAFGDFLIIKILGFALCVAVFLDATVIRLALGPALIRLAGRWNWWPGGR